MMMMITMMIPNLDKVGYNKGSGEKGTPSNAQKAPSSSPPRNHPETQQQADQQLQEISAAEFRIQQLKLKLEEETRLNLECLAQIEEKEAKIQRLREANEKEKALLDENMRLIQEVTQTAAEIDAMSVGEDEEQDSKAASKRPSSSKKASILSGK